VEQSGVGKLLLSINLFRYYGVLQNFKVTTFDHLRALTENDWKALNIPPFHSTLIIDALSSTGSPATTTTNRTIPVVFKEESKYSPKIGQKKIFTIKDVSVNREERRQDPPTARLQPGKRFLEFVPDAPHDQQNVIDCLFEWARAKKLETFIDEN